MSTSEPPPALTGFGDPFRDDARQQPGGSSRRCPVCLQQVAVGVQCSLCHRWYHITAPPSVRLSADGNTPSTGQSPGLAPATPRRMALSFGANIGLSGGGLGSPSTNSGRRGGCVAVPFLMPFFCSHCCRTASEVVLETTRVGMPMLDDEGLYDDDEEDGDGDDADIGGGGDHSGGDLADRSTATPFPLTVGGKRKSVFGTGAASVSNARRNKELVERAIGEIAKAPEITRSSRAEVQVRWKNLFQPSVLRRARANFAARGLTLYADFFDKNAGVTDPTKTMPQVEPLETDKYDQHAEDIIQQQQTGGQAASRNGHLDALERQSDTTLRQQRRMWVGQSLDYANVSAPKSAKNSRAKSGMSGAVAPPGGTDVRLSHVAVTLEDSDDDGDDDGAATAFDNARKTSVLSASK